MIYLDISSAQRRHSTDAESSPREFVRRNSWNRVIAKQILFQDLPMKISVAYGNMEKKKREIESRCAENWWYVSKKWLLYIPSRSIVPPFYRFSSSFFSLPFFSSPFPAIAYEPCIFPVRRSGYRQCLMTVHRAATSTLTSAVALAIMGVRFLMGGAVHAIRSRRQAFAIGGAV